MGAPVNGTCAGRSLRASPSQLVMDQNALAVRFGLILLAQSRTDHTVTRAAKMPLLDLGQGIGAVRHRLANTQIAA